VVRIIRSPSGRRKGSVRQNPFLRKTSIVTHKTQTIPMGERKQQQREEEIEICRTVWRG